MTFKLDSEKTGEELLYLVKLLRDQVNTLQKTNFKLWEERNAAIEGGLSGVKALYVSAQAKDNARLNSRINVLNKRLEALLGKELEP
jgi:hypothetical protein